MERETVKKERAQEVGTVVSSASSEPSGRSLLSPLPRERHRATAIQVSEKEGTVFVRRRQGGHKERLVFFPDSFATTEGEKNSSLSPFPPGIFYRCSRARHSMLPDSQNTKS